MQFAHRIIACCVGGVFASILLSYAGSVYVERVNERREQATLSCAMELGIAAEEYEQDHNNQYPHAGRWEQELAPYLAPDAKRILHPPGPWGGTTRRFSFNPALSGQSMAKIEAPAAVWMFYESVSPQPSASDDLDYWPQPERDGGSHFTVLYGDGHSYSQPPEWKQGVKAHLPGF